MLLVNIMLFVSLRMRICTAVALHMVPLLAAHCARMQRIACSFYQLLTSSPLSPSAVSYITPVVSQLSAFTY
jgi:hypothetical protein